MGQSMEQHLTDQDLWQIRTIEKAAVLIGIAMLATLLFLHPTTPVLAGLVSGIFAGLANFRFLQRLVATLLGEETGNAGKNALRFAVKIILLLGFVAFMLFSFKVNVLSFVVGFSSIILGIFYEGLKSLF